MIRLRANQARITASTAGAGAAQKGTNTSLHTLIYDHAGGGNGHGEVVARAPPDDRPANSYRRLRQGGSCVCNT